MTAAELAQLARQLYDACPTSKPTWDQLGDVTRSVWIERAQEEARLQEIEREHFGDPDLKTGIYAERGPC